MIAPTRRLGPYFVPCQSLSSASGRSILNLSNPSSQHHHEQSSRRFGTCPLHAFTIYGVALCLWQLRRYASLAEAATAARAALDSGRALARFKAFSAG